MNAIKSAAGKNLPIGRGPILHRMVAPQFGQNSTEIPNALPVLFLVARQDIYKYLLIENRTASHQHPPLYSSIFPLDADLPEVIDSTHMRNPCNFVRYKLPDFLGRLSFFLFGHLEAVSISAGICDPVIRLASSSIILFAVAAWRSATRTAS